MYALHVLMAIGVLLVCFVGYLLDDSDDEPNPIDLARPSIERLEANARRAADELRQLEREVRR
jgi:hypothetical protein